MGLLAVGDVSLPVSSQEFGWVLARPRHNDMQASLLCEPLRRALLLFFASRQDLLRNHLALQWLRSHDGCGGHTRQGELVNDTRQVIERGGGDLDNDRVIAGDTVTL